MKILSSRQTRMKRLPSEEIYQTGPVWSKRMNQTKLVKSWPALLILYPQAIIVRRGFHTLSAHLSIRRFHPLPCFMTDTKYKYLNYWWTYWNLRHEQWHCIAGTIVCSQFWTTSLQLNIFICICKYLSSVMDLYYIFLNFITKLQPMVFIRSPPLTHRTLWIWSGVPWVRVGE